MLAAAASCRRPLDTEINPAIESAAIADSAVTAAIEKRLAAGAARESSFLGGAYEHRNYRPVWVQSGTFSAEAQSLFRELESSVDHGLDPAFYELEELRTAAAEAETADDVARLDLDVSRAFVDYASDLGEGRSTGLESIDNPYSARDDAFSADTLITRLGTESVDRLLDGLAPQHETYRGLQQELERYRRLAADGGWPELPNADVLEPGDTSSVVGDVSERLVAGGFLDSRDADTVYTERIAAAVRAFQEANGLARDSLYGPRTRAVMNITVENRIQDIRVNLERWRRIPYASDRKHVRVNVPAFRLQAHAEDESTERMKIIAGETGYERSTPVFSETMEYVVFGPFWNIPETIAREEIIPKARKNEDFLADNRYEIVAAFGDEAEVLEPSVDNLERVESGELKMRQAPGNGNALGRVKFMFPNRHSVYLHDTPADHLFEEAVRDFSHGCIRVERPADLAEFALGGNSEWNESRIREAMNDGRHQIVTLDTPVDVYIIYMTASIDTEGRAVFFPDIYDRDAGLESLFSHVS